MKYDKNVILLAGPTASGKSKLAIKLAKHLKGEIIIVFADTLFFGNIEIKEEVDSIIWSF